MIICRPGPANNRFESANLFLLVQTTFELKKGGRVFFFGCGDARTCLVPGRFCMSNILSDQWNKRVVEIKYLRYGR